MHIAMIGQKGIPARMGGVERHVEEFSRRLCQLGFLVSVYSRAWYTGQKTAPDDQAGLRSIHLPSLRTKHFDTITHTLFATMHALRARVDVIHYHGVGPSLWSWLPRIFSPHTIVITTFHSLDRKHEKWGLIARLALRLGEWTACRFAHKTIAVSPTLKQYIRDVYNTEALFIPNAVPAYTPIAATDQLASWDLQAKKYFLAVCRLIPHKGVHHLINAYNRLCRAQKQPLDTKLVIVGDGHYTDRYVLRLRALAAQNPNIIFTGAQAGEPLAQLFSHAAALIHPSDKEGLPLSVLEGMSYKLPVLVSDIPEHLHLIPSASFVFARGNAAALAERLSWLLREPKNHLAQAGAENRARVRRDYDWDTAVTQLISVYESAQSADITPNARVAPTPLLCGVKPDRP